LLSILIPFISTPLSIDFTPPVADAVAATVSIEIQETLILGENTSPVIQSASMDYFLIFLIIYGVGVFVNLFSFVYKISVIKEIILKGTTHDHKGIWITKTSKKTAAFSFFKNIVIDEQLEESKFTKLSPMSTFI
jgi:hypothetical protein